MSDDYKKTTVLLIHYDMTHNDPNNYHDFYITKTIFYYDGRNTTRQLQQLEVRIDGDTDTVYRTFEEGLRYGCRGTHIFMIDNDTDVNNTTENFTTPTAASVNNTHTRRAVRIAANHQCCTIN